MPEESMLPSHHQSRSRSFARDGNLHDQLISSGYNNTFTAKGASLQPDQRGKRVVADARTQEQKMQKLVTNKVTLSINNNDNNTINGHTKIQQDNPTLTAANPLSYNINNEIPYIANTSRLNTLKRPYQETILDQQSIHARPANAMYHQQPLHHPLGSTEKGRFYAQINQSQQYLAQHPRHENDERSENVKKPRVFQQKETLHSRTSQQDPSEANDAKDLVMTERLPADHEDLDNPHDLPGYRKISKIGEGTYGVVFKAEHKASKEFVALKKIRLNLQEGIPTTTLREIAVLKELKHENIVRMTDMIQKNNAVYLVFDYSEVDLRKYMEKVGRRGLTVDHIRSFMHQLLRGLHYCHTRRILHRDLKPQNLLIDCRGRLTIADLGLARSFGVPMRAYTHQVVTLWYRAPEILLGSEYYSTAVDMWSVGCIMAEMIAFRPLFPGSTQIEELFQIFQIRGTPTEEVWPGVSTLRDYNSQFPPWKKRELKTLLAKCPDSIEMPDLAFDLLERLLAYDPCNRITARSAEEHDFFYSDISQLQF